MTLSSNLKNIANNVKTTATNKISTAKNKITTSSNGGAYKRISDKVTSASSSLGSMFKSNNSTTSNKTKYATVSTKDNKIGINKSSSFGSNNNTSRLSSLNIVNNLANKSKSTGKTTNIYTATKQGSSSTGTVLTSLFKPLTGSTKSQDNVRKTITSLKDNISSRTTGSSIISGLLNKNKQTGQVSGSSSGESKNLATDLVKDTVKSIVPATLSQVSPSNVFGRLKEKITGAKDGVSEGDGTTRVNPLGLIGLSTTLGSTSQRIQDSFNNWKSRLSSLPMLGGAAENAEQATSQMGGLFGRFQQMSQNFSNKLFGRAEDVAEVDNASVAGVADNLAAPVDAVVEEAPATEEVVQQPAPAPEKYVQPDTSSKVQSISLGEIYAGTNHAKNSVFVDSDGHLKDCNTLVDYGQVTNRSTNSYQVINENGERETITTPHPVQSDDSAAREIYYDNIKRNQNKENAKQTTTTKKTNPTPSSPQYKHREGVSNPYGTSTETTSGSSGTAGTQSTTSYSPPQREKNITGTGKPITSKNTTQTQTNTPKPSDTSKNPRATTQRETKPSNNPRAKENRVSNASTTKNTTQKATQKATGNSGGSGTATKQKTTQATTSSTQPVVNNTGRYTYITYPDGKTVKYDNYEMMRQYADQQVKQQKANNPLGI